MGMQENLQRSLKLQKFETNIKPQGIPKNTNLATPIIISFYECEKTIKGVEFSRGIGIATLKEIFCVAISYMGIYKGGILFYSRKDAENAILNFLENDISPLGAIII